MACVTIKHVIFCIVEDLLCKANSSLLKKNQSKLALLW